MGNSKMDGYGWLFTAMILVGSFYFAPRLYGYFHGIGINHETIHLKCFDEQGDPFVDFFAGSEANVYHTLTGDGYWFEQGGITTVIPNGKDCVLKIKLKKGDI